MKFVHVAILTLCPALAVTATLLAQQPHPMREGNWEVVVQMQIPNAPAQMPEMKMTQCVTAEHLKDPTMLFASGPAASGNESCTVSDYKTSNGTVSWKMACTSPQAMTGSGEMTFTGDTYKGTITMSMPPQGEMAMNISGKRLGECAQP